MLLMSATCSPGTPITSKAEPSDTIAPLRYASTLQRIGQLPDMMDSPFGSVVMQCTIEEGPGGERIVLLGSFLESDETLFFLVLKLQSVLQRIKQCIKHLPKHGESSNWAEFPCGYCKDFKNHTSELLDLHTTFSQSAIVL